MVPWLVWMAVARAAPCQSPQVFDTLVVSSWNTWGLPAPLSKNRKARFERIDTDLEEPDADLVLLQEVWRGSRPLLPKVRLVGHADELGDSGLAFVSPRPIHDISFHPFLVSARWEGWKHKGVLTATTELHDGTGLLVVNTHFQAGANERYAVNRASDTEVLLQAVSDWSGPVLIAGDFNFYTESPTDALNANKIWEAGFDDVAVSLGRAEVTYRREKERFDRIFLRNGSGVCLHALAFDTAEYQDLALSDHQPVVATVEVGRDGTRITTQ